MRDIIKQLLFIAAALLVSPLTLCCVFSQMLFNKDTVLASFSQLLSLLPGKLGSYLRAGFYRFTLSQCSPDAVIGFATLFSQQDTEVHAGAYIGPQCNIGRCSIGHQTLLGSGVHIMSGKGQHNFDILESPIKDQGGSFEKISIGSNCWVGNGSLIMASIGNNCVVGAGSVVTEPVPMNAIVAGNPAKIIKMRS